MKEKTKFMWEKSDDGSLCIFFAAHSSGKKWTKWNFIFLLFLVKKNEMKRRNWFPTTTTTTTSSSEVESTSFVWFFVCFFCFNVIVGSIDFVSSIVPFFISFFYDFSQIRLGVHCIFLNRIEFFFPKQNESHSSSDALGLHLELDFTEFFFKFLKKKVSRISDWNLSNFVVSLLFFFVNLQIKSPNSMGSSRETKMASKRNPFFSLITLFI